ncbi:MAG TPA: ATP-binding cassette domain-containing protein [Bacteroidia bacterium]|jgi:ABC-type multidrug transport system ATPase subunit|nr:ATP-binding cassette domain-containing protein [Bacteroidia bacterium]
MSERILRALMQLFAIIARVDGVTNSGRNIVQSFLKQQLNQELVDQYLALFDEYLESHHSVSKKKDGSAKRTSLNSVKVLKICTEINKELEQNQKIIVLIRLLEFICSNQEISEQEYEFVSTVAETFNIPTDEFKNLKNFVEDKSDKYPDSDHLLVINSKQDYSVQLTKHIYCDTFNQGIEAWVISIPSVGMYALKLVGTQELQLNGQAMKPDQVYIFTPGSSLRSTKVKPIYYSDVISKFLSDKSSSKVSFQSLNLEYKFPGGKLGLRNINISEESGKLIGIMGGSGAGKSTLLNVLNGIEIPSGGAVLINGINIHTQKDRIEGVIGHVSQDDLLIEELTVYQNLFYNAKLCFGNFPDTKISAMVMETLNDLGLEHTRDLKVGSPLEKTISGGQRKRLNIGLELIREPAVLFVDEPTSGLSSRDSENIMDLLKELSLKGKLVFVVIHQPSSEIFKMFDKLMILDVGGYPIYYGNPVDAVIYFKRLVNHVNSEESECISCGNVNPELIFNIIETKVVDEYGHQTGKRKISPVEWNAHYKEQIESKIEPISSHTDIPESTFKIPNKLKQFFIFAIRDIKSKLTNTQYLAINLLEAPVLAFILAYFVRYFNTDADNVKGYIYRENENIPIYMFMSIVVALFIGLTVSAEEIIRDRKIQKRESFLNLSRSSYLISKIGIMFALSAVQALTFILVGNSVLGVKGMWCDYWLVLFTTSCFANMLGLNISSSFNTAVTIYILIPFLIIPQLLLSGVMVKFDKLNPILAKQGGVPLVGEMMTSRWAFEALAVNQFKSNAYEKQFYKYDKAIAEAEYKKTYWAEKLTSKIAKIEKEMSDIKKKDEFEKDLTLIRNELQKEADRHPKIKFEFLDKLFIDKASPQVLAAARFYLNDANSGKLTLKQYYINREKTARDKKEEIVSSLNKTDAMAAEYIKMQDMYENEALNNFMKNENDLGDKCLEKDGILIQRTNPIFLDPDDNYGRAHFYAPQKRFFGRYYQTFWFNLCVIWGMSVFMMITLYFDVLKKLLDGLGNLVSMLSRKRK